MSKIEQIEKLLKKWKAEEKEAFEKDWDELYYQVNGGIQALTSALEILNEPSNNVNANVCAMCNSKADIKELESGNYYCYNCIS